MFLGLTGRFKAVAIQTLSRWLCDTSKLVYQTQAPDIKDGAHPHITASLSVAHHKPFWDVMRVTYWTFYYCIIIVVGACSTSPCHVSQTCTDMCTPGGYSCACIDVVAYGEECENRDGGITEWSEWGNLNQCFPTCTLTRERTCDNPSPMGQG